MTQTPGPSITSRPQTNKRHWLTLAGYVALGIVVTVYVVWTVLSANASPLSLRSGLILTGAALFSFFAYIALFRDAVHLSHAEVEWTPNWLWYFAVGFAIPLATRLVAPSLDLFGSGSPLVIVYSLVVTTTVVCTVYLYRRRKYTDLWASLAFDQ